jgi:MFS family permease
VQDSVSPFVSARAKTAFWAFTAATFLAFLTSSTLSYLAVILTSEGMTTDDVGMVLSSPLIPITLAILFSGGIIDRYGAYRTALIGLIVFLASFLSLQFAMRSAVAATLARGAIGVGFGLFFPAAMVHARSFLQGPRTAYLFGIFSSMVPMPQVIGPGLAEWYFQHFGPSYLFFVFSTPMIIGIAVCVFYCGDRAPSGTKNIPGPGYLRLLASPAVLVPNLTIFIVGLVWGFSVSFMALLLHESGVPNAYFFSSCTIALLVCRFTILAKLSLWPKPIAAASGLLLMGCAYLFAGGALGDELAVVVIGAVFGAGYSMAFPILGTWVSDQFRAEQRGKPMALFSAVFHGGMYIVPIIATLLAAWLPLVRSLGALGMLAGCAAILLASAYQLRSNLVSINQPERL